MAVTFLPMSVSDTSGAYYEEELPYMNSVMSKLDTFCQISLFNAIGGAYGGALVMAWQSGKPGPCYDSRDVWYDLCRMAMGAASGAIAGLLWPISLPVGGLYVASRAYYEQ